MIADGTVVRDSIGHYRLASIDSDERLARSHNGARMRLTAALAHGWGVARSPTTPQLAVPEGARHRPPGAIRRPLTAQERRAAVTSPLQTVLDCARALPSAEGLAVADSALRSRMVGAEELTRAAARLRGPGAPVVKRVAAAADARAAGPFESVTRAICLDVEGLVVTPQFVAADDTFRAQVDLADEVLGIVIECDSFTWHGSRAAMQRTPGGTTPLASGTGWCSAWSQRTSSSSRSWRRRPFGTRFVRAVRTAKRLDHPTDTLDEAAPRFGVADVAGHRADDEDHLVRVGQRHQASAQCQCPVPGMTGPGRPGSHVRSSPRRPGRPDTRERPRLGAGGVRRSDPSGSGGTGGIRPGAGGRPVPRRYGGRR